MIATRDFNAAPTLPPNNQQIANRLDEVADLLEADDANPFRVRAYRNAAQTLRTLDRPAYEILAGEGQKGLMSLPTIGKGLARVIDRLVQTGELELLDGLRGESTAETLLASVWGMGPELAHRVHAELGINTLEELEAAAHDGRLDTIAGMGPRRVRAIRETLAGRFRNRLRVTAGPPPADPTPVDELLDVDREYRAKAEAGELSRIAPRRFNPSGEAWLPVLSTKRGRRRYTVLFSNTAAAHDAGATRDWVVIYREGTGGRWTVVTRHVGPLRGLRVVRGRDEECAEYYRRHPEHAGSLFDDQPAGVSV